MLNRRFFALLMVLALSVLLAPAALADDETDYIQISDAEGLRAMAEDPRGSYMLVSDIDMAGEDWTPFEFFGVLDGGGHCIINLTVSKVGAVRRITVDGNHKEYDTLLSGLFSATDHAVVRNLSLFGLNIAIDSPEHCFVGGIAGWGLYTDIEGCAVEGRILLTQSGVMCGVAGLIGYGNGDISGCGVDVELVLVDTNREADAEEFAGGAVACGYPNITGCTVRSDIYTSVHGYVHNGGLVGMHHVDTDESIHGSISGNTVDCRINFFEDVGSRRAYGAAYLGEKLNPFISVRDNTTVEFVRTESRDYETDLYPCICEANPRDTVVPPDCLSVGYTTHTCSKCGYSYNDSYTLPRHSPGQWTVEIEATYTTGGLARQYCEKCGAFLDEKPIAPHVAGDWEVAVPATYSEPGLRVRRCSDCGAVLEEETIAPHVKGEWLLAVEPTYDSEGERDLLCADCSDVLERESVPPLVHAQSIGAEESSLKLNYRQTAALHAAVSPHDASEPLPVWSSLDDSVAQVDENGLVTATGRGETEIICRSADGMAETRIAVSVGYSFWQWLIVIICFGWLWY